MENPTKRDRPAESESDPATRAAPAAGKRKPRHKPRTSEMGTMPPQAPAPQGASSSSTGGAASASTSSPASSAARSASAAASSASSASSSSSGVRGKPAGRKFTVSIAVPGSILAKAQSAELQTYLAGQIARAATLFAVDEVVVFDDHTVKAGVTVAAAVAGSAGNRGAGAGAAAYLGGGDVCALMARLLQYAETPPYMRKALFPRHKDLRLAGLLSALDAPHHVRKQEWTPYREGVVVKKPLGAQGGSLVNCGLVREVRISQPVMTGVRVTVRLEETEEEWGAIERCERGTARVHKGVAVSPGTPRALDGTYWGYVVRMASGLGEVFTGCPFKGGYDLSVGVAERGTESADEPASLDMPKYKHALVVFGGADGLDEALAAEEADTATGLGLDGDDVASLFDHWFNPLPDSGSRSTRTEETVLVALSALRPFLLAPHRPRA